MSNWISSSQSPWRHLIPAIRASAQTLGSVIERRCISHDYNLSICPLPVPLPTPTSASNALVRVSGQGIHGRTTIRTLSGPLVVPLLSFPSFPVTISRVKSLSPNQRHTIPPPISPSPQSPSTSQPKPSFGIPSSPLPRPRIKHVSAHPSKQGIYQEVVRDHSPRHTEGEPNRRPVGKNVQGVLRTRHGSHLERFELGLPLGRGLP